ncbi:MAG: DUF2064 domain-containing protein, partial [Bacteroidota bacterium]
MFAREAKEEAYFKNWDREGRPRINKQISSTLTQHTLQVAHQTGLPVIWIDSDQQRGDSFGERLRHAFEDVFALGYQQVIAIGNDCPHLSAQEILAAAESISTGDLVAGRAADGGVYLIGLHCDQFSPQAFQSLAWETTRLQQTLDAYAQIGKWNIQWMATKQDLDSIFDLQRFIWNHSNPLAL